MIGKRIEDAMNEQIKHELESAYLYLSMVAYFEGDGLEGMGFPTCRVPSSVQARAVYHWQDR